MFKAVNKSTGFEVIILDRLGGESLSVLRSDGRAGLLACPHCAEPVIVRAGEINRHHFAHQAGVQCPFAHEPADRLAGRAALYGWLRVRFKDGVTIEKMPDGLYAPRPVDGWVETAEGQKFAYFIVDRQLKREEREHMPGLYAAAGVTLHWLFLARWMRRPEGVERDRLRLTSTERECMEVSRYNEPHASPSGAGFRSIHYLDAAAKTLTSFRAMRSFCGGREYTGAERTSPLNDVLVGGQTGEFVHPGEYEQLKAFRAALRAAQEEYARRQERLRKQQEAEARERERLSTERMARTESDTPTTPFTPPPSSGGFFKWEATCVFCGRETRDWYRSSGGSAACVCKACRGKDDGRPL